MTNNAVKQMMHWKKKAPSITSLHTPTCKGFFLSITPDIAVLPYLVFIIKYEVFSSKTLPNI